MRVTSNTFPNTLIYQLQRLTGRINQLQEQTATGQRIVDPSDDPAGAVRVLNGQAEQARIQQFHRNALRANDIINASTGQLRNILQLTERANEIIALSDEVQGKEALQTYGIEVDALLEQMLVNANTRFNDEPLFGGTTGAAQPFEATRDANGKIVSVAYVGTTDTAEIQVAVDGRLSPYPSYETNQDILTTMNNLIAVRDALATGDSATVKAQMDAMNASEDALIGALSAQGALQARIEIEMEQNRARYSDLAEQISRDADVDLSQTIVQLTQNQNAYQAALMSAGKVLDRSLLDYL
ncbi:MAG: flagellin [Verrucomicrobia bacterium]|nr:MAG: flagellin [Verrucomicrobiota bacterium]